MSTYSKYLRDYNDDGSPVERPAGKLGLEGDADDIDLICFETAKLRRKRELQSLAHADDDLIGQPRVTSTGGYIGQRKRRSEEPEVEPPASRPTRSRESYAAQEDEPTSDSIWSIHIDGIDPVELPELRRNARAERAVAPPATPSTRPAKRSATPPQRPVQRSAAPPARPAQQTQRVAYDYNDSRPTNAPVRSVGDTIRSAGNYISRGVSNMSSAAHNGTHSSGHAASSGSGSGGRRRSGSRLGKLIRTVLVVLIAALVCWYAVIGFLIKDINIERVNTTWSDEAPAQVSEIAVRSVPYVTNVLLLGIDDDGSSGSRSDTIMIASVNSRTNTIKLCSILRDCYVAIPEHSATKINAAYAYGGAELAMRTVQNNFRVRIDKYAALNRSSMIAVVEAVGGVDIEITEGEAKQINKHSLSENPDVSAGMMHLDGRQAVAYAQIRKIDSDFNRTSRQRTLLNAIVAKSKTLSPGKLMNVVEVVSERITTNMGAGKISSTGLKVLGAIGNDFEQMAIPADGTFSYKTINGASMVDIDLEANVELLHEFLFGDVKR